MKHKENFTRENPKPAHILTAGLKNFILDLDGCLCLTRKSIDPRRLTRKDVLSAIPVKGAKEWIGKRFLQGHHICIFTCRESTLRSATVKWLRKYGFKYHSLVMGKPLATKYHYIDDRHVQATRFEGYFTDLTRKQRRIQVFG